MHFNCLMITAIRACSSKGALHTKGARTPGGTEARSVFDEMSLARYASGIKGLELVTLLATRRRHAILRITMPIHWSGPDNPSPQIRFKILKCGARFIFNNDSR